MGEAMKELWIAGRVTALTESGQVWDFQGVFEDEGATVEACRDWTYFVMPVNLGESLQHETLENPRGYYPIARREGDEL